MPIQRHSGYAGTYDTPVEPKELPPKPIRAMSAAPWLARERAMGVPDPPLPSAPPSASFSGNATLEELARVRAPTTSTRSSSAEPSRPRPAPKRRRRRRRAPSDDLARRLRARADQLREAAELLEWCASVVRFLR